MRKILIKVIISVFIAITLNSCLGIIINKKRELCQECLNIEEVGIDKINGYYEKYLWTYIRPYRIYNLNRVDIKDSFYVSLNYSKKTGKRCELLFKLYKNGEIISEKKIKGKIINGYIVTKHRIFPLGVPPIYYWQYENILWITVTKKDELFIHLREAKAGWLFLLLDGQIDESDFHYNKIKLQ